MSRLTTTLTFIFGVGLFLAAVWVIWRIGNDNTTEEVKFTLKLASLTCFTFVFGVWVALFMSARRSEIFGVTAVYAAVLIVFVGTS